MKKISNTLLMMLALSGCSEAEPGDKFVGGWKQVNASGAPQITANITRDGSNYDISLSMPLPNGTSLKTNMVGNLHDGVITAERLENISMAPGGHMRIGTNEFEKTD